MRQELSRDSTPWLDSLILLLDLSEELSWDLSWDLSRDESKLLESKLNT